MMKQIESALWDMFTVEEDEVIRTSTPDNEEWYVR
jgi:hypothetical protein